MAYALYGREYFETDVNGKHFSFTCYSQGTSYGFRHICTLGYNNTTVCKYIKDDIIARASYCNRTWERFRYETVLRQAIENLDETREVKQELHDILIEGKHKEIHEQVEKDLKEFETLWNGLSEKNKEHVQNGLGDNLIQTKEQADGVIGIMKLMTAFQTLGVSDKDD